MTIVIGIQAKDGAVIASDCSGITSHNEKFFIQKINAHLFSNSEDSELTGIYFGTAGHYYMFDIGFTSAKIFSKFKNAANLLTNEFLLNNSLDQINENIDCLERGYREVERGNGNDDLYYIVRVSNNRTFWS